MCWWFYKYLKLYLLQLQTLIGTQIRPFQGFGIEMFPWHSCDISYMYFW